MSGIFKAMKSTFGFNEPGYLGKYVAATALLLYVQDPIPISLNSISNFWNTYQARKRIVQHREQIMKDDTSFMVTDATDKTYKMTNDLQTGSLDSGLVEDEFVTEQGWDDDEFEEFDFEGEEEEQY